MSSEKSYKFINKPQPGFEPLPVLLEITRQDDRTNNELAGNRQAFFIHKETSYN